MIVKIRRGIGNPGKLWTGSEPEDGSVVDARIIERTCSVCEATTRRLRTHPVEGADALAVACEIPILFVTMGGVGSIAGYYQFSEGQEATIRTPDEFQLWNWSERVGGHALLEPVAILSGYWDRKELPRARAGYVWFQTYGGSTLSEFLLLEEREEESRHALPVVSLSGTCPPCRHKAEMDATPEDLGVVFADFEAAGAPQGRFDQTLITLGLPAETITISARRLLELSWEECGATRELYLAAIDAAKVRVSESAPIEATAAS